MNLGEILEYKPSEENYYTILGCAQSSNIDQINREYKLRALQYHPDKNPSPDSLEKFRLLQRAKETLSNPGSKKSYDSWLNSGLHIPFEQWQSRKGPFMHWATPKSSKLCIEEDCSKRQGSDYLLNNDASKVGTLHKFRNYEI